MKKKEFSGEMILAVSSKAHFKTPPIPPDGQCQHLNIDGEMAAFHLHAKDTHEILGYKIELKVKCLDCQRQLVFDPEIPEVNFASDFGVSEDRTVLHATGRLVEPAQEIPTGKSRVN